jgi:hypothetical protein
MVFGKKFPIEAKGRVTHIDPGGSIWPHCSGFTAGDA